MRGRRRIYTEEKVVFVSFVHETSFVRVLVMLNGTVCTRSYGGVCEVSVFI